MDAAQNEINEQYSEKEVDHLIQRADSAAKSELDSQLIDAPPPESHSSSIQNGEPKISDYVTEELE